MTKNHESLKEKAFNLAHPDSDYYDNASYVDSCLLCIEALRKLQEEKIHKQPYLTFSERNDLLNRWSKLLTHKNDNNDANLIIHRALGAYSVTSQEPFFWQHLEKFVTEFESRQGNLFQQDAKMISTSLDNFSKKVLDKLSEPR